MLRTGPETAELASEVQGESADDMGTSLPRPRLKAMRGVSPPEAGRETEQGGTAVIFAPGCLCQGFFNSHYRAHAYVSSWQQEGRRWIVTTAGRLKALAGEMAGDIVIPVGGPAGPVKALCPYHAALSQRRPAYRALVCHGSVGLPGAVYAYARYNVLFPMGFDAFGLPAENTPPLKGQSTPARLDPAEYRKDAGTTEVHGGQCLIGNGRPFPACPVI